MTTLTSNPNESMQVSLQIPLQTPSGVIHSLTFRRGKVRDMLAAQRIEEDAARRELVLMSILAQEKITVEDLEELDLVDFTAVQAAFQGLFQPTCGQPDSVAGASAAG